MTAAMLGNATRHSATTVVVATPRSFGWVGAMVLLVLLAAAGLPASGGDLFVAAPVAARNEGRSDRAIRVVALAPRLVVAPVASARVSLPRVLPRSRSVQRRGLPPSRAPTA